MVSLNLYLLPYSFLFIQKPETCFELTTQSTNTSTFLLISCYRTQRNHGALYLPHMIQSLGFFRISSLSTLHLVYSVQFYWPLYYSLYVPKTFLPQGLNNFYLLFSSDIHKTLFSLPLDKSLFKDSSIWGAFMTTLYKIAPFFSHSS